MTLPALEQAPTRLLSVAADAPASAVGVCSSALVTAFPDDGKAPVAAGQQSTPERGNAVTSAAHVPPEPQSSLQTSRGFRTDQANDLACVSVRSGVAALDSLGGAE